VARLWPGSHVSGVKETQRLGRRSQSRFGSLSKNSFMGSCFSKKRPLSRHRGHRPSPHCLPRSGIPGPSARRDLPGNDPVLPGPEGLPTPSGLFVGKPLIVRSPIPRLGFVADRLAAGEAVGSNVAVADIGSRPALQAVGAITAKDDVVAVITSHGVISASA
jgi:hypothetical protein